MSSRIQMLRLVGVALLIGSMGSAAGQPDHSQFTKVLMKHVVRGEVDYAAIKLEKGFDEYLSALSRTDPRTIKDDEDRLAFWINAYNAFTIKLVIDHLPVRSIREITRDGTGPWDIVWIAIGGKKYSLNQIEHEIIRKEFDEPRIHMALVCAAKSCPPLRSEAYVGARLQEQLDQNARVFLQDESMNRFDKKTEILYLSEVFNWYGQDFVKQYGSAEQYALRVMGLGDVTPTSVEYLPYDWSLNGK